MKRTLFSLVVLLAAAATAQDLLLSENFNSSWSTTTPPAGWRIVYSGDVSSNDWSRAEPNSLPWLDNPTAYALIDSVRPEQGFDSLITPFVNCSDYNQVTLRCSTFFRGRLSIYTAKLLGGVGGVYNHVLFDYFGQTVGPELQTFDLSWAAGQADVGFAWVVTGQSGAIPHWALDNVSVIGTSASILDVACLDIAAPPPVVDSGAVITPQATVRNLSNSPATFPVIMEIGWDYSDTVQVSALAPNESRSVSFDPWTAQLRGAWNATCHTEFPGDVNPANDTQHVQTRIRVTDITVEAILAPSDTVDSGVTVQPIALVRNLGTDSTPAVVSRFSIGSWHDSTGVPALAPGGFDYALFGDWLASDTGVFQARCTVQFGPDMVPANNFADRTVIVASAVGWDAAALNISNPTALVAESADVSPGGIIANRSPIAAQIRAVFRILRSGSLVYEDSNSVLLQPGWSANVVFGQWTAWPPDNDYEARLRVYINRDVDPTNDSVVRTFSVRNPRHDAGVVAIIEPTDTAFAGPVTPRAKVRNFGDFTESFYVQLSIDDGFSRVYSEQVAANSLASGDSATITFPPWQAAAGNFTVGCSTRLLNDAVPDNDYITRACRVFSLNIPLGWHEREAVPFAPGGKDVKGGGALSVFAPLYRVYALKGNKTTDFFYYDVLGDTWRSVEGGVPRGAEDKAVKDGGAMTNDGNRYIYLTKGNNTQSFYRYDIPGDSWHVLPVVPLGISDKKVKGGTSLAYVRQGGFDYVYLLKGYKNEFYRFNVQDQSWEPLPAAPTQASEKYNKGSFIVYDGSNTIYAHQVKYNQLFAFDIAAGNWRSTPQLLGMPLPNRITGKSKKSKDGASGVWHDGSIYALKGGGTQEFWRYYALGDSWSEQDTLPNYGSTGRKKAVKGGGSIASLGSGIFFAIKGNKTHEFWSYRFASTSGVAERPAVLPARASSRHLAAWPNPARGRFTVAFGAEQPTPALLRLYDIRGALVLEQRVPGRTAVIDCPNLPRGIYFVGLAGQPHGARTAIVIQ
jgi:hypothetical protein